MFDIKEQVAAAQLEDEGTRVHLRGLDDELQYHKKGDETVPTVIVVAGANSKRMRRAEEEIRRRKLRPGKLTSELIHNDTIEKAAACTISWEGIVMGGEPFPCNPANATQLYKLLPWVLDQVVEAQYEHNRFSQSSSE